MDNASFHKGEEMQRIIRDSGHILLYLPPYSPDLNPIEHKWAQAKSIRRTKNCSIDEIFNTYLL
jgi:transposase